ncbi:MAG: PadR family transcriptional regulator [Phycisphaerales bacterium]
MPSPPDPVRGAADLLVLSVIADEPLYGYAIGQRIEVRSEGRLRLGPGALYPLLHQLESDGHIKATWDGPEQGGRPRKWYRLTAKGRRHLARRAEAHRRLIDVITSFLPDGLGGAAGKDA